MPDRSHMHPHTCRKRTQEGQRTRTGQRLQEGAGSASRLGRRALHHLFYNAHVSAHAHTHPVLIHGGSASSYSVRFECGAGKGTSVGPSANPSSSPRLGATGEVDGPDGTSGSHSLSRQRGEAIPVGLLVCGRPAPCDPDGDGHM